MNFTGHLQILPGHSWVCLGVASFPGPTCSRQVGPGNEASLGVAMPLPAFAQSANINLGK